MIREWLREARIKADKTQQQVADDADITKQHYNHLELGTRNTKLHTWEKIGKSVGLSLNYIVKMLVDNQSIPDENGIAQ